MEMYLNNDTLYISIFETINFRVIHQLKKKLYPILDMYHIYNIEISILNDQFYESSLVDEFVSDYNRRYNGNIIIK